MNGLFQGIVVIVFGILLAACGSTKALLAEKEAEIEELRVEKERGLSGLRAELESLEQMADEAQNRADRLDAKLKQTLDELQEARADIAAEKTRRRQGARIIIPNTVFFASGSARLGESGKKALDEIWNVLEKYPDRAILIEGHTDNVPIAKEYRGIYKSNWELSAKRALAVLHYLRKKKNIHPSSVGAVGYGEHRPVADNTTEDGRKQNRRVVIVIASVHQ